MRYLPRARSPQIVFASTFVAWLALPTALVFLAAPPAARAKIAPLLPPVCAAVDSGRAGFAEPADVRVWTLPRNAQGENELILSVHQDKTHYCYQFTNDGVTTFGSPTIRVRPGEHFALRIVNDLSGKSAGESVPSSALAPCTPMAMGMAMDGATLPVHHYTGYLNHTMDDVYMAGNPLDTNIHLHGFEGPAEQENVFLSTLSTPMHACEYHITIPATQPPGTYFYHPHVHASSWRQVSRGLSGVWIVESPTPAVPRENEHVLVIRYRMPFTNDNNFAPDDTTLLLTGMAHLGARKTAAPVDYDPFHPPPWPITIPLEGGGVALDPTGCDGIASESVATIDGHDTPVDLQAPGGATQVLRILNATTDTPKLLQLRDAHGTVVPLRVAEMDGVPVDGDAAKPLGGFFTMDELMLAPAARASILVTAPAGQTLTLSSRHYCSGAYGFFQLPHDLVRIAGTTATPGTSSSPAVPNALVSSVAAPADEHAGQLVAYAEANPSLVRRRAITFTEYLIPKAGKVPIHYGYFITDTTNRNFHEHEFNPVFAKGADVPSNADVVVKAGSIEEWYLFNTTLETHTFHIHQMAFVNERGPTGVPTTADTVFIPLGKLRPNPSDPLYPLLKPSVTKVLLDFRHVPRGTFVFHCHMLFHEDHGMMAIIRVV